MLQRDYFMRMTEMLAAVIAKILLKKETKDYTGAEIEIESAAKTIVGLDLKLLNMLSIDDILRLMITSDLYAGKCMITAKLLKEYGEMHMLLGKENEGADNFIKSLHLYIEALLAKELPDPEKYFPEIYELTNRLNGVELSDELNYKLCMLYEISGQYSKAEDLYFELIEKNESEYIEKAVSFYEKLRNKSEEELVSGNLSSIEVQESLEELLNRKKNI